MNTPSYSWLAVLLLSTVSVPAAAAAPAAIVEGLQAPAWVERAGTKSPLKQGMTLQSGDKVLTGPQSRALLRLEEGSQVKLGENGQVNLDELNPPEDSGGLFKGVLGVLKGAFMFMSDLSRSIDLPVEFDFMAVSSYGSATRTSGARVGRGGSGAASSTGACPSRLPGRCPSTVLPTPSISRP